MRNMFKVNKKTSEDVTDVVVFFLVNFEHSSHLFLVFLLKL